MGNSSFVCNTLKTRIIPKGFIGYANEVMNSQNWFPPRWKECIYVSNLKLFYILDEHTWELKNLQLFNWNAQRVRKNYML